MDKKVPEFAIFQNSATHRSAIWTVERGKWVEAGEDEYNILNLLVGIIRTSDNPSTIIEMLKIESNKIHEKNNNPNKDTNN